MRLKNKVILVTASTRGIGLAIVKKCAEEGARVYMAARNMERAQEIAHTLDGAKCVYNDATQPETFSSMVEDVVTDAGYIDVLVNNFGTSNPGRDLDFANTDPQIFLDTVNLNLQSVFMASQAAAKHTLILQVPGHAALHLLLGFLAALSDQGGVSAGEVGLYLTEHFRKRHPLGLGYEKQVTCLGRYLAFRKDGSSGTLLEGDVMHFGLVRLCLRCSCCRSGGEQWVFASVAKHQNTSLQIFSISLRKAMKVCCFMPGWAWIAPATPCRSLTLNIYRLRTAI